MEFWNQKTFCLVTGASKGIGRTIAIEFSKQVGPNSVFLLLARSGNLLEETVAEIADTGREDIQVVTTAELDLAKPDAQEYLDLINTAIDSCGYRPDDFEHSILVHNAASVGDIRTPITQMEDLEQLREYFDVNLISMILLTTQFFKVFENPSKQRSLVQITSAAGVKTFKGLGQYSAGKAARNMITRSIAAEDASISTISYSPGPVDTELFRNVALNVGHEETRKHLEGAKASGKVHTTLQVVTKLIRILGAKKYSKGEYVQFSDIE